MLDKELLLKPRLEEEDYDIDGVGTVRIRRLSWYECGDIQKMSAADPRDVYRRVLALAMVDPPISEDEAGEWMCSAPVGEIETLARHILAVSGLTEGAQKSV